MKILLILLAIFMIFIVLGIDYFFYRKHVSKDSFSNKNFSYLNDYFQQIYVITLPQRRGYIQNIMNIIKVKCHYFPAISKASLDKNRLITSGFLSPNNKLNNGQIACHLSHISVLKKFLASGARNCLIFEDDLKMPELNNQNLDKTLSLIPSNYDIIYLGRCWDSCQKAKFLNEFVLKCYSPQCRHAYGVSRKGAEKIIRFSQPLDKAGDLTISQYVSKGQIIAYAPKKSIFFQNREQLGSNLNNLNIQKECV